MIELTKYDIQNPYLWTYLAFVHLYKFQPRLAERRLVMPEQTKPDIPEVKTLKKVTNIMESLPLINS